MASCCILVLLDGLGDRAYTILDDRTPLEAALTPNLDRLAARGWCGLFHAEHLGSALPSENAHFAMFGYAKEAFPGRGYLEALGAGLPIGDDDVALLAHFVGLTLRKGILYLEKDRPEASAAEIRSLVQAVETFSHQNIDVNFRPTRGVDGIITLAPEASPKITDTDPLVEGMALIDVEPYQEEKDNSIVIQTAEALKSYLVWCFETLARHPINQERKQQGKVLINGLVTQRAGQRRSAQAFLDKWGLRALSVSSGPVYHGLCRHLGMDSKKVSDTGNPGRDLAERLEIAISLRHEYDFIHVHTKAPDAAAHSKNPGNKVAAIESLDRGLEPLIKHLDNDETLFVVTADHSTPSGGVLVHSGEPVPIMFIGPGVRRDRFRQFDEVSCAVGSLGYLRGSEFMPMVLNCLDRSKLQGLMDTPEDQPYWPGARKPFRI